MGAVDPSTSANCGEGFKGAWAIFKKAVFVFFFLGLLTKPHSSFSDAARAIRQVLAYTVYEHSFASRCFVASDRTDAAVRTT